MERPTLASGSARWLERISRMVWVPALVAAVAVPINQLTQNGGVVKVLLELPAPDGPREGTWYEGTWELALHVWELPWWLQLLTEGEFALRWVAIGVGAYLVSRVLHSIHRGDPFDASNPRRIGLLAICVALGTYGAAVVANLASVAVLSHLDIGAAHQLTAIDQSSMFSLAVAGLVFVVAGVFQRGRQLSKDTEGLV